MAVPTICRESACATVLLFALFSGAGPASAQVLEPDELLRFWSPVLVQDLEESLQYRGDYLTAFDFDGSLRLDNNETNAVGYPHPSVVYSWWAETRSHVLLGYSFYRVSGAERRANDLRSAVVLLEAPSESWPRGRFVGLAFQAGRGWSFAAEQDGLASRQPIGRRRPVGVDADVDFVQTQDAFRPVLYGTLGDHDLQVASGEDRRRPTLFERNTVTIWGRLMPMNRPENRAKSTYPSGKASDYMPLDFGIVYAPGQTESVVAASGQNARGKLSHHWEVFSYGLRSIEPLWRARTTAGSEEEPVFDRYGRLVGEGPAGAGSLPPWMELKPRRDAEGRWETWLQPSEVFFGGTDAFVEVFEVPAEPILRSSLGSAQSLLAARDALWNGLEPSS